MWYLEKIAEKLMTSTEIDKVSIIKNRNNLKFAITPSIYLLPVIENSKGFINLSGRRQHIMTRIMVVICLKDFMAKLSEINSLKDAVLNELVGFSLDNSTAISFSNINNVEQKNVYFCEIEFEFSYIRGMI